MFNQFNLWFTHALILTFSPWEKEQLPDAFCFVEDHSANPANSEQGFHYIGSWQPVKKVGGDVRSL
jgi:hypothetical protein